MPKTFATIALAAALFAGTTLAAAAQLTTAAPGLSSGAPNGDLGPGGAADTANSANTSTPGNKRLDTLRQPFNRLGSGGSELLPGGNGALGAGDTALGDWTGTSPVVNRNYSGYNVYGPPNAFGGPSVARGAGPPVGVSR